MGCGSKDEEEKGDLQHPLTGQKGGTPNSDMEKGWDPVKEIIEIAHQHDVIVLVDGAQSAVHLDIDVQNMDCDFFVLSSHKIYGPTGVGVLYGKKELLEEMPPYMGGGEMIKDVTFDKTSYNDLPYKFEAGTPNIADTVAFKAALDFVPRDMPVKAAGIPDRTGTHARLGQALQRLYPTGDERPDWLAHLLRRLDRERHVNGQLVKGARKREWSTNR